MNLLKQSTAAILKLGPFVDDTDFKTAETGLSIGQSDIQISKGGAAFAQTSDGSPTTTHDADGWYPIPVTSTDTGTCGPITVQVTVSGALPVWWHGTVVPANVYDALVGGTDYLQVDAVEISGDSDAANNLESAYDGTGYDVGGIDVSELNTAVDAIGSDGTGLTEAGGTGDHLTAISDVQLADDAITAAKFDESTAYPLTSADTGSTAVARTGADGDTLETLSDQVDGASTHAAADVWAVETKDITGGTVDTCTTNTDMRGTDNAALAATALSDATWTDARAGYLDNIDGHTAQTGDSYAIVNSGTHGNSALKTLIDGIKTNTDDLADGERIDLLIDAIKTVTDDWADGERLDLLIDGIKTNTDDLADGERLDLLIDAIKAKTDNLEDSWENVSASDVTTAIEALDSFKAILSSAHGKVTKSDSAYTFYADDNTTPLFTLTYAENERTRS